jgi:hypothetical protein
MHCYDKAFEQLHVDQYPGKTAATKPQMIDSD